MSLVKRTELPNCFIQTLFHGLDCNPEENAVLASFTSMVFSNWDHSVVDGCETSTEEDALAAHDRLVEEFK